MEVVDLQPVAGRLVRGFAVGLREADADEGLALIVDLCGEALNRRRVGGDVVGGVEADVGDGGGEVVLAASELELHPGTVVGFVEDELSVGRPVVAE